MFALAVELVPGFPDAILGQYGALVLAVCLLAFTGRLLWWFIKDLAKQRDLALDGWREQTAATKAIAAAVEERNRREAEEARLAAARLEGALAAQPKRPKAEVGN